MELLDGKWLEKFFYLHLAPLWPDGHSAIASSLKDSSDIKPPRCAWEYAGRQTGHMTVRNRHTVAPAPARLARVHCQVRELPARGLILMLDRKSLYGHLERSDEVTGETPEQQAEDVVLVNELLVEEVSIDGMCGVY
jgi:mycofactocin precursor